MISAKTTPKPYKMRKATLDGMRAAWLKRQNGEPTPEKAAPELKLPDPLAPHLAPLAEGLYSPSEIIKAKVPMLIVSGIYFLIENDQIIYVGQSVSVHSRLAGQCREKTFTHVAFLPCAPDDLDVLESKYIHVFRPRLNGKYNGKVDEMQSPVRLADLLSGNY